MITKVCPKCDGGFAGTPGDLCPSCTTRVEMGALRIVFQKAKECTDYYYRHGYVPELMTIDLADAASRVTEKVDHE